MRGTRDRRRRTFTATCGVIVALAATAAPAAGQERAPATEYEVKAAFLYNFSLYVQWPESAFERTGDRFVVGVLGRDPFDGLLEQVLEGEPVGPRTIQVRHFTSPEAAREVQILFVGSAESVSELAAALGSRAVLTVGESPGFAEREGMIGLRVEGGKVRLEVNLERARAAGLRISSQLLKLARLVGRED